MTGPPPEPPARVPIDEAAASVRHGWRTRHPGRRFVIEVADNGPGIPPRVIETLFKPFSPSRKNGGSGLGLAIARELAQGMNSSLDFVTTGPEGTRFELILPAG